MTGISGPILPGLGPPVQFQQAPRRLSSASTSCSTILSFQIRPCRPVCQHSSHSIRHRRQRVLLLDNHLHGPRFCVNYFPSFYHGDVRALKEQRPWSKKYSKDAFNSHATGELKKTVDVPYFNKPLDGNQRPPENDPSLVTHIPTACEPQFPAASLDQSKSRDIDRAPGNFHRSTSSSTLEVVRGRSKACSKPVPTVSSITEPRRLLSATKIRSDQRAPSLNNGRPGRRFEASYVPRKPQLPRSTCNSNPNSSEQSQVGLESKNTGSGTRNWARDSAQGNGRTHAQSARTTTDAITDLRNRLQRGITADSFTYVQILKMCSQQNDLFAAKQVHESIIESGMGQDPYVAGTLLNVYIKCRGLVDARRVFDEIENKTVIHWNSLIAGYAKNGKAESAFQLFKSMRQDGAPPNNVTYLCILKACASPSALKWGKEVHACIPHGGFESDMRVGSALLQMYVKCGCIAEAKEVFENLTNRNIAAWNIMIRAHAESGRGMEAYELFLQMRREGFEPDAYTYTSILNASAGAGTLEWVKKVHGHARQSGLESDLRVGSALVHNYAKSGSIEDARLVFDRMDKRDALTWNRMIAAYADSGRGMEAYGLFCQMGREGFEPDEVTYLSILTASASAGDLEWVRKVHGHARQSGLELDLRVGSALVHVYAKSGSIEDARLVFDRLEKRDAITWNIMIGALAQHGCGYEALELFRKMNLDSVKPSPLSFVALLSACSHGGLVDDGRRIFSAMTQDYGIEPTIVHYTCMVDLLGRAGHLEEAKQFISDMPVEPDAVIWKALLGACRTYRNVELGELAAQEVFKLEPNDPPAYVLLSNIYAAAGKWDKVSSVRRMMQERNVRKEPGRSWIEVDSKIHEFVVGDTSHPEAEAIYTELNKLTEKLKAEGYIPDTRLVLHDINEEDKELALCSHSEKLAIVYGLMHVPSGEPIRVSKNLRVCSDCHSATKYISKVTGREIIARDASRFHHFKDGMCSCDDYW